MLFNGTHVESGGKTLYGTLKVNSDVMIETADLNEILGQPVRMSTANLLSARFPIVTPGGLIKNEGGTWGNVVDGGYNDNTGIETAFAVMREMMKLRDQLFFSSRF